MRIFIVPAERCTLKTETFFSLWAHNERQTEVTKKCNFFGPRALYPAEECLLLLQDVLRYFLMRGSEVYYFKEMYVMYG